MSEPSTINPSTDSSSMSDTSITKALQFESKKPDIGALVKAFTDTRTQLQPFVFQCKRNADTRFCRWSGQTWDQRKHTKDIGQQAMPWEGASDMRFFFIDSYIKFLVATIMAAWRRARVTAYPTNNSYSDIRKANRAATFVKWIAGQIPGLYKQSEIALNYLFEKGICVTYQCWRKEIRKLEKCIKLGDFPDEIQQIVLTPEMEQIAIKLAKEYLNSPQFNADYKMDKEKGEEDWSDADIKGILNEIRKEGETYINIEYPAVDRAEIYALTPDEDIFFPPSTIDIQNAPYCFQVMYYTPQEMRMRVQTEDWDSKFVEYCIDHYMGVDNIFLAAGVRQDGSLNVWDKIKDVIQIIHVWRKVTDKEGNLAIYETVMHPNSTTMYGVDRLSDYNHGEYPFVVTKFEDYSKRLYEVRSITEVLKGTQENYKAQLDAKIDRTSLTNLPPILRVYTGLDASGGYIAPATEYKVRSVDEMSWMAPPAVDPIGEEMLKELQKHADTFVGRVSESGVNPVEAQNRMQMYADKWSEHAQKMFKQLWSLWMQYGSDETKYRVTGSQEILTYQRDESEHYDWTIALNTQTNDSEIMEKKLNMVMQLIQQDTTGTISRSKLTNYIMNEIDSNMADDTVSGEGDAQQQSIKDEQGAIGAITSGLDVDLHPNELNQTRANYYMQWYQRPDVQQRLQSDRIIGQIAEKRAKQWQQQIQQFQVNAQTGKLGTAPGTGGEA